MKLLKIDWVELEDAFQDASREHRYYLDRETGQVYFFSIYLDNEEEKQEEKRITTEDRYVPIPFTQRLVPFQDIDCFVRSLDQGRDRQLLASSLRGRKVYERFTETLNDLPEAREKWSLYLEQLTRRRMKEWLTEVGVQPIEE